MTKATFDIVFCADDKYSNYLPVTILSIVDNNPDAIIHIHILTDYISKKNRKRLIELSDQYPELDIQILTIDDSEIKKLPTTSGWTSHTWYRILIPRILSSDISKVLYLDVDTLVVGDLSELFHINLEYKSIAASPEANYINPEYFKRLCYNQEEGYICAGVMMMNLNYWRDNNLTEKSLDWAHNNKNVIKMLDQDVLNYICHDSKIILPLRYGVVQWYFTNDEFYKPPFICQIEECLTKPVIIHYAFTAPWFKDSQRHIFTDKWLAYNQNLKHPVRIRYKAKGLDKIKIIMHDMLYSSQRSPSISVSEIIKKINKNN